MEAFWLMDNWQTIMTLGFMMIAWIIEKDYLIVVAVSTLWPGYPYQNAFISLVFVIIVGLAMKLIKEVR